MSIEEKQLSGAMRIFEALSGVDEELLVKCEDVMLEGILEGEGTAGSETINGNSKTSSNKVICVWNKIKSLCVNKSLSLGAGQVSGTRWMPGTGQFAGTLAAVGCVIVVGISLWNGTPKFISNTETAKDCGVAESTMEAPAEQEPEMAFEGAVMEEQQLCMGELEITSVPQDNCIDISLEEAQTVYIVGEYVPARLPEGYAWESGKATERRDTGEIESIALCWINGMDSIEIYISQVDSMSIATIDINEPESYDVHLYEIPYAETVPEKYWESFSNPIFKAEDFSEDIVEARMKVVEDAGDTSTPRGNFAVLYGDSVLVRFSGRGSVEEIWNLFQSIK